MKTRLVAIALMLIVAACATPAGSEPTVDETLELQGLVRGEGNARIPSYRINGWSQIDDQHLVVTAGVNNRYLVELRGPCPELEFAFTIGFTTSGINRLDRFGDILLRGPGGRREFCPIQDIYQLYPF